MGRFFSLPKKMVLLLLLLLLLISAAMSTLWLMKTNEEFHLKQQEIRQQNQVQYLLLNQILRNRLESWVELLVQMHPNDTQQMDAIAQTLAARFDFLQLNWQVEGVWLFNSDKTLIYSSQNSIPDYIRQSSTSPDVQQRSTESIYCHLECTQVLSIPLLNHDGSIAVVTISYGLVETLAFLNQSTDAIVALVHVPSATDVVSNKGLYIRGPLAKRQHVFIDNLVHALPEELPVETLIVEGVKVELNGRDYFVVLLPMSTTNSDNDFVLAAHDITPIMRSHTSYQRSIIITALVMFLVSLLTFYLLTNSVRRRLLRLSARLPLLAQRNYQQFRERNQISQHFFRDELDTLNDSANELAERLELLDEQVLAKTSELENIALYDQLTQLPNRNLLTLQLEQAVANLNQRPGIAALLFFDLDDFKKVNDSYGHSIGDELLIEASFRFKNVVRDPDLACRFGGDEFAILIKHAVDIEEVKLVAEKLLDRFRQPINVENLRFYVSTSIGIAITQSQETQVNELLRQADVAMYQAKRKGGNCYYFYDAQMSKLAIDKVEMEDEARRALLDNQFSFALQPQIELSTGRLMGFEALLRWHHPDKGQIPPGHFIPILENTEFMLTLGYWCIEHAYSLLMEFKERGLDKLKIAINLAGIQFLDSELVPCLLEKTESTGIRPELLELELTERTLVSDVNRTTVIMQTLVDKGFLISIDDFGTGYSSLSYLKKMPAQFIKIDRAFIDGMLTNRADRQIVASTVAMVQRLGMKVIAEGIETSEQIDILQSLECDLAQGYFISYPIPEHNLFDVLQKQCREGIWLYNSQSR